MNSPNNGFNGTPGEHPSLELLRQYQAGVLPPEAEHLVERHLLSCNLCTDVAEGMAVSPPAQTQAAVQDLQGQVRKRLSSQKKKESLPLLYDWRAAAAVLVLLCSLGLVIYQQFSLHSAVPAPQANAPKPPKLQEAEPPLANKANTPPPAQKEVTFKPSAPPVAYQNSRKSITFTPPVVKKDEEVFVAEVKDRKEDKPTMPPAAETPAPQALATKVSDTLLKPDQPVLTSKRQADEEKAMSLAQKPSASNPKILIRGSAALPPAATPGNTVQLVSGQVVSSDGEGLPGVTVQLKGTTQTVATDAQGTFKLTVASPKATLVFNYIGFQPKEVTVKGEAAPLEVKLQEDLRALSEVVVVGYGSQRRSDITASAAAGSAKPVAGLEDFQKYVRENLRYPQAAREDKVKGRVVVKFTVSASGQAENLQVVKSLSPACDAEVIRLIKEGPAWKPSVKNGTPVPQQVKVSIRFKPE